MHVTRPGFTANDVTGLTLRASETVTVKVKLVATGGHSEVTVFGTAEGVRADSQIGRTLDSQTIDETPILGRKVTTLPLFNSAFRQGKGTGDLFVNATYFITGGGSRRTTTYMLDGASNDEGWGRQTMLATVPVGAIQEASVLTNAFSAEFGWTAGPALNIVTKSGTNSLRGEVLYLGRPGGMQAKTFSTDGFCAPSVSSCVTPTTLTAINPADVPDALHQYSGSMGGALIKDKTFFFASSDYTRQDRTTFLSPTLPAFVLPADGGLSYVGNYRQGLVNARVDHKLSANQTLMVRWNYDHFYDTNPNDAVAGTNAPTVARRYTRGSWTTQANHTMVLSPSLLNEAKIAYLHGDPVTLWEPQELSTTYTRARHGAVHDRRVAHVRSLQLPVPVRRHDDLVEGPPYAPARRQHRASHVRRQRQRARTGRARHVHVPQFHDQAVRSAHAGRRPAVLAAADVRQRGVRAEAVDVGRVRAGQLPRDERPDAGPRPALRPADADRRQQQLGAAVRLRLASQWRRPDGDSRRLRQVLHADPVECRCEHADGRPGRADDIHGDAGTDGLPHLSHRAVRAAGLQSGDAAALAAAGAQHHHSRGTRRLLPHAVPAVRPELRSAAELPGPVRESAE